MTVAGAERRAGRSPFAPFLARQGFVVLDGGCATALEARGHVLDDDLWSARLILDAPDEVRAVHRAFLDAGADCITTAGYQASFEALARRGLDDRAAAQALRAAVVLALEAREAFLAERRSEAGPSDGDPMASGPSGSGRPDARGPAEAGRPAPLVAASAGPYGASLADGSEYVGRYGVGRDVLRDFHLRRFEVLAESGADLVALETIPALDEAEVIADILHGSPVWAWVSFTCRDGRHLRDGSALRDAIECLRSVATLAAVGVNCTHPRHVGGLLREAAAVTHLPLIAYPNSGEGYDPASKSWVPGSERRDWAADARRWAALGARVVGGCCRVGPAEVEAIRRGLEVWAPAGGPLPPASGGA